MPSSSSRRESRSETRRPVKKTVGCMTGIFHFLSRHHHSGSQKRLTSAKEKDKTITSLSRSEPPPKEIDAKKKKGPIARAPPPDLRRSPTIPAEIRRPSSAVTPGAPSPESPCRPPALVARLMGLEEIPTARSPEPAAEKRRRLLGALEKCDEDLKALKRIIEAVSFAEIRVNAVSAVGSAVRGGDGRDQSERVKSLEVDVDQPSPVSVLDAITSPRFRSRRFPNEKRSGSGISAVGPRIVKPSRMGVFFVGDRDKKARDHGESWSTFLGRIAIEGLPPTSERRKEGEILKDGQRQRWRRRRRSQAMVESVGEVWEDGLWEERWELGRIGVGLEVDIFGDLVEEVVVDLMGCHYKISLPLRRWRKRLCF